MLTEVDYQIAANGEFIDGRKRWTLYDREGVLYSRASVQELVDMLTSIKSLCQIRLEVIPNVEAWLDGRS